MNKDINRELIINATPKGTDIALIEDGELVELHREAGDKQFATGDMFLGRITRLVSGLNAAFVDVGYEKDAFLHYTDLSPVIRSILKFTQAAVAGNVSEQHLLSQFLFEPEIHKGGKIEEVLRRDQPILVQILKEPISTKGPRLTCELALPGRYLVLVPFSNNIGISKKIGNLEERKRLQRLIESIRPKNFGVVVRTVAEGKSVAALHEDMNALVEKWKLMVRNLAGASPVKKVHSEVAKTTGILRDLLNDTFNQIVVNSPALEAEVKEYINRIAPDKIDIVKYYNSKTPIFDHYHITRQIKSLFGKTVALPGGAYIIIEKTEACHVIDVNSGQRVSAKAGQEQNALRTNLDAAKEIARQLRLRDMGGIIICDFIDMKEVNNKQYVYNAMKQYMENDRARHTILPLSKFNLMQITRERTRPEITVDTSEECPACHGTGKIGASILIVDELEEKLDEIMKHKKQKITLYAHPYLAGYLKYGLWRSRQMRWFWKYKQWIPVYANEEYHLAEYHFMNKNGEEIVF